MGGRAQRGRRLRSLSSPGASAIDEASAIDFLTFDRGNPSSICNCLENARANGRAVRTALTVETWTAINDAWLELKRFEAKRRPGKDLDREALTRFLDYVKKASLDFDGSCYRTMLRNDAYWFNRLGVFVERADNTARLLDVKYHLLLPSNEAVGGSLDYFQWVAILRAVSAATAYHWVYRDRVKPWLIADLLILKPAMPRSLIACYVGIDSSLNSLAREDGRSGAGAAQGARDAGRAGARRHGRHLSERPARIHHRLHRGQRPPRRHDLQAVPVRLIAPGRRRKPSQPKHAHPHRPSDDLRLLPAGARVGAEPAADAAQLRLAIRVALAAVGRRRRGAAALRGFARQRRPRLLLSRTISSASPSRRSARSRPATPSGSCAARSSRCRARCSCARARSPRPTARCATSPPTRSARPRIDSNACIG